MLRWLMSLVSFVCFVAVAQGQSVTFDPNNPLPGKKPPTLTGPRALIPATLSLALASGSSFLAYKVIVEEARPGEGLPKGSFLVGMMAVTYPSIGRLFVPENHTLRSAILFSTGRFFAFTLFYASNIGVSSGGRGVAQASFLGLTGLDIALTARLRFPEEPKRVSWAPTLLPGGLLGVGGAF